MSEAPTLYPTLRYRDARQAIAFLQEAFGFRERVVYANEDGTIAHAELTLGNGILMLGSEKDDPELGPRAGRGWMYVAVEDPDALCERARKAGAEVFLDPHDTDYGSRDFAARDLEGNHFHFGTYRPAAEPAAASASGGHAPA